MSWAIERTCSNCGSEERIRVSKREAAFELLNIDEVIVPKCKKCSSSSFSTSYPILDLDLELLKEWATNLDLYLMPQDEELLLADNKYLGNILFILDNVLIPENKRNILMNALCVIVYDNTVDDNHAKDEMLKNRVIEELNKRTEKLKQADDWIMSYIKEVVYPQLKLNES